MVQAAAAGVTPDVFDNLTLGEVFIAIEGYQLREKNSLINRIVAIGRGLAGKDALDGLVAKKQQISDRAAALSWFWSPKSR